MMHSLADIALERVDQLILSRMLVNAKLTSVRDDIGKLAAARLSTGEWKQAFDSHWNQLLESGLIQCKQVKKSTSYDLTEEGRARAFEFLQIDKAPAKLTWPSIQANYLLPLALKIRPGSRAAQELAKAPGLRQAIIAQSHGLSVREGMKGKDLLVALAWKLIGIDCDAPFTVEAVVQRLLWPEGSTRKLTAAQIETAIATVAVSARKATPSELRVAAVRAWLLKNADAEFTAGETDLAAFAHRALEVARHSPTGRFGGNKVFISHVWRQLHADPSFASTDLGRFKQRLVEANREGLLHLSRADLVEAMDPKDVRESLTEYENATFHFVRI